MGFHSPYSKKQTKNDDGCDWGQENEMLRVHFIISFFVTFRQVTSPLSSLSSTFHLLQPARLTAAPHCFANDCYFVHSPSVSSLRRQSKLILQIRFHKALHNMLQWDQNILIYCISNQQISFCIDQKLLFCKDQKYAFHYYSLLFFQL